MKSALVALALVAIPAPSWAGQSEDAYCLASQFRAADAEIYVDELMKSRGETGIPFDPALAICMDGQDWTTDRVGRAIYYATGLLSRQVYQDRLERDGVEVGDVDRWFARQTEEFRVNAFTSMAAAPREATIASLTNDGATSEAMNRHPGLIGAYLAALVMIERMERDLPVN